MATDWIVLVLLTGAAALALVDLIEPGITEDDAPMRTVDDVTSSETLEFWSRIYAANSFSARVTFQQFMTNPRGYVSALLFAPDVDEAEAFLPLLPLQEVVRERVLLQETVAAARERESAQAEAQQLRHLARTYDEISTNDNRLCAPMRRIRSPKKYKTRGAHLHPHLA